MGGDHSGADRPSRPAVMTDVGRLAGVSHQTVSRVINGSRHVSPATRQRVIVAMAELGYRPNSFARALATGHSRTLGVITIDSLQFGPAQTLFGIERAAHAAGYFTLIASLRVIDRAAVTEAVERMRLQGVEGMLVIVADAEAADALLEIEMDVPLVCVEAGPQHTIPLVTVDSVAGATMATRHLLELGHATVHHVTGPPGSIEARQRVDGWRATLQAAGAEVPAPLTGDWGARSGYHAGRRLAADPTVTAIFAANDQMALGVLRALHEAGRRIPDDVSVVGFDDQPEAQYFMPPLTTIRQDFGELGSRSLLVLVRAIAAFAAGQAPPVGSRVSPELIVRASTIAASPVPPDRLTSV